MGLERTATSALTRFIHQLGWAFFARLASSILQLGVIVLLARGLPPHEFAWVASANVAMMAVIAINGFGLTRQIQLRRARDPQDPALPTLFNVWQSVTFVCSALWFVASLVLALTVDGKYLALAPVAVWLSLEQTTSVWNALSLVDGRSQDLMPSYLWRRVPVVLLLVAASAAGWNLEWTWTLGLVLGSALAYVMARAKQEPWVRTLMPRWPSRRELRFDFGYWFSSVGIEIRDLDVAALSALDSTAGGIYALPARLVRPMNLVTVAVASVVFPRFARRPKVSFRLLVLACLAGTVPVLAVAGAVAAAAPWVPSLVGEEYRPAIDALRILCLAAVVTGFGTLVVTFLQTRTAGANRFTGVMILIFGFVQILAAAWAGSTHGANGAAVAAVVCQGVLVAILFTRAVKECGVQIEPQEDGVGQVGADPA